MELDQITLSYYTWALEPDREQLVILCLPGAGYTALSFALFTQELSHCRPSGDLAVVALNWRGHGGSTGDVNDLSLSTLQEDVLAFIDSLKRLWTVPHQLVLLGHSLGGSVATRLARHHHQDIVRVGDESNISSALGRCSLLGLVVVDIVEETALRALSLMPQILANRPKTFPTLTAAIQWALQTRLVRNRAAAAISLPDQLTNLPDDNGFEWRIDLNRCREHWESWFRGLSDDFVTSEIPRLLVLAEREYLDRPLMIASMQGKFQCAIIRDTGHAIQEDAHEQLTNLVLLFADRCALVARLNQRRASSSKVADLGGEPAPLINR